MAIQIISAPQGGGKTQLMVTLARKQFKKENTLIKQLYRLATKKERFYNNIYSDISIELRKGIYSHHTTLSKCTKQYCYNERALILIDEPSKEYDSKDYKNIPRPIINFMYYHRHYFNGNIIFVAPSPNRVFNEARNSAEKYTYVRKRINFLWLFTFSFITHYYTVEDYRKYNHVPRKFRTYDYKNKIVIYSNKVFKKYNSRFFRTNYKPFKTLQTHKSLLYDGKDFD